jgi:hypothetical protein
MARLPVLLLCIVSLLTTGCNNVLKLASKKHYKENSIITSDSVFTLYQNVCYDKRNYVDEEFCYELRLKFIDTTAARIKKKIDLESDSLIVKASYGVFSMWNWGNENNQVSGQIEILKWGNQEIILRENIQVRDIRRKKTKQFRGTRTFKPKKGW